MKPAAIFLLCFFLFSFTVYAQGMESERYKVQLDEFDVVTDKKDWPGRDSDVLGQTESAPLPFSFSLSETVIDLGSLAPNQPVQQSLDLTISGSSYQITAFENHPLQIIGGSTQIPDTLCNGGDQACHEIKPGLWDDDTKYGFGFNTDGGNYYRQFADLSKKESPQIIKTSAERQPDHKTSLSLKVNISEIQALGNYENIITFVTTPGY